MFYFHVTEDGTHIRVETLSRTSAKYINGNYASIEAMRRDLYRKAQRGLCGHTTVFVYQYTGSPVNMKLSTHSQRLYV